MESEKVNDSERVAVESTALFGLFATATVMGGENGEPRQGWVINEDPLIVRGETGTVYVCEGEPTIVNPQPAAPWWKEVYEFGLKKRPFHIYRGRRRDPSLFIRNPENGGSVKSYL